MNTPSADLLQLSRDRVACGIAWLCLVARMCRILHSKCAAHLEACITCAHRTCPIHAVFRFVPTACWVCGVNLFVVGCGVGCCCCMAALLQWSFWGLYPKLLLAWWQHINTQQHMLLRWPVGWHTDDERLMGSRLSACNNKRDWLAYPTVVLKKQDCSTALTLTRCPCAEQKHCCGTWVRLAARLACAQQSGRWPPHGGSCDLNSREAHKDTFFYTYAFV